MLDGDGGWYIEKYAGREDQVGRESGEERKSSKIMNSRKRNR